ncbi:MAG: ABC transporter ATP-binding protein [Bacteroides sp.]|nr:ABC transporter ATP-binding protein [Bacteroides sp.]MDD4719598.1 ABC transporter ATP-binding protein [Bacteroides sp.]
MTTYKNLLKKHRVKIIWSPILVLIFVICETTQPYFMSLIIDQGIMVNDWTTITKVGIAMIGISLISLVANLLNIYISSQVSVQFGTDLRNQLFNKIQTFSLKDIDQFQPSTLITRLTNDISMIQRVVLMLLRIFLRAPLMLIFAFLFIIKINPSLSIIVLIGILILAISIAVILKFAFPLFTKTQEKLDQLNRVIQENLNNIRVVKAFAKEEVEINKFQKSNIEHRDVILKAWDILVCAYPLMQLIINTSIIVVLWIGGNRVMNDHMQVGELIAIINYFVQILMALMMLSFTIMGFARAMASSKRIKEVLHFTPSIVDNTNNNNQQICKGSIEFREVNLHYSNEDEGVLNEVSFYITPGETVAIVGATGSGKSSLLNLIPRLYDATSGDIFIDGKKIKDYSKKALRDQIGVVFQVNDLFTGSIAENLRWGNLNASQEELEKAAKMAEAHSFILDLEKGYETQIGRGGINLSGGQRQRICIARALLSQPKILLLDDCTSAVDASTEKKIWRNLSYRNNDMTTLIVTQRIHTLNAVHRVIVMDEGTVVAFDTPQKLIKTSKAYQELFYSQININS